MKFLGAGEVMALAHQEQSGKHNYFLGNNPEKWATDVRLFGEVRLNEIWKGVDAKFYFDESGLRYDFALAPEASPEQIRLAFDGAEKLRLNADGELVFETSVGEKKQEKLFAYQQNGEEKRKVECGFTLKSGEVGFSLGDYDRTKPLVIDPLVYSTLLAGNSTDRPSGIIADEQGNAYVTGWTISTDFPRTLGNLGVNRMLRDVFVTKMSGVKNSGGVYGYVYSTIIGCSSPTHNYYGESQGIDIAIDPAGNAYVAGLATANNFPLVNQISSYSGTMDAILFKLNDKGELPANAYYVIIRHNRHLAVMTKTAITLSAFTPLIDFTRGTPYPAYVKPNAKNPPLILIDYDLTTSPKTPVWAMIAGDVDQNKKVEKWTTIPKYIWPYKDEEIVRWAIMSGTVYPVGSLTPEDVDMNGIIDIYDYEIIKTNNGRESSAP